MTQIILQYSVKMLHFIIISYFVAKKFWCIFVLAILKTNPVFSPPV